MDLSFLLALDPTVIGDLLCYLADQLPFPNVCV